MFLLFVSLKNKSSWKKLKICLHYLVIFATKTHKKLESDKQEITDSQRIFISEKKHRTMASWDNLARGSCTTKQRFQSTKLSPIAKRLSHRHFNAREERARSTPWPAILLSADYRQRFNNCFSANYRPQ